MNVDNLVLTNLVIVILIILASSYLVKYLNNLDNKEAFNVNSCSSLSVNDLRKEQIIDGVGDKEIDTIFGTPKHWSPDSKSSYKNLNEDAPVVLDNQKSLVLFKYNQCKPECCENGKGNGYSCSKGCICNNKQQNDLIASRGDNKYPNEIDNRLKFKPYEKIIKDNF
jgi:hypothetical protein